MWNIFQAIKRSWLKHFITQITAFCILTMTYMASLFIALSMFNVKNVFHIWGKVDQATIYLKEGQSAKQISQLLESVRKEEIVKEVQFVSSEDSAAHFKKRFSKMTPQNIEAQKISQFFPSSIHVFLSKPLQSKRDIKSMRELSLRVKKKFPIIDEVTYGQSWMRKFISLINGFEFLSWIFVIVIFASSLFVSANVLKTIIFANKDEIEILEFVGATPYWTYTPPVLNCCILSALAFAAAATGIYGVYSLIEKSLSSMFSNYFMEQMTFLSPLFLVVFFTFLIVSVFIMSIVGTRQFSLIRQKNS